MRTILFLVAALAAFLSTVTGQTSCYGSCVGTGSLATMQAPASLSVSAPFGATHNAFTIRPLGGPDAVAAVCARSFGASAPFPFPVDPAAGNVLVDAGAPLIDLNAMVDVLPGGPVGVQWGTLPLAVPNDPALVGLTIHSQAALLLTSGAWAMANCAMTLLTP